VKTLAKGCGCFMKVYVCPGCLVLAGHDLEAAMRLLTEQLQLGILDTRVSVSANGKRETNGEYSSV